MINSKMNRENSILASDMDEVITNISPLWYKKIRENFKIFEPYLYDLGELSDYQVMMRTKYYLNDWLKKKDVDLPDSIIEQLMDLYTKGDFYSECKLTAFGNSLNLMSMQSFVKKIYIISHTIQGCNVTKEKWIKNNLNSDKVELILLNPNESKSNFLKDINYTFFADDRSDIIEDVMKNTNSYFKEFLTPKLGYNREERKGIMDQIYKRQCSLKTYENIT